MMRSPCQQSAIVKLDTKGAEVMHEKVRVGNTAPSPQPATLPLISFSLSLLLLFLFLLPYPLSLPFFPVLTHPLPFLLSLSSISGGLAQT